jgi:hypothetical protein
VALLSEKDVPAAVHKATAHHAVSLQHAFAHGGGGNRENKRTCGRIALAEVLDELAARQLDVVAGVVAVRVGHCPLVPVCAVDACARACRPEVGASHDTGVPYLQRRRDGVLLETFAANMYRCTRVLNRHREVVTPAVSGAVELRQHIGVSR